jgi:hypothetical protein
MKFCFRAFLNFEILTVKEINYIQNGGCLYVCALTVLGALAGHQTKIMSKIKPAIGKNVVFMCD